MSDNERDRSGLAVLVLTGFLILFLLAAGGGVTWYFIRRAAQAQLERLQRYEEAMMEAQARQAEAEAAAATTAQQQPTGQ
jgi:predicted negative regulator of RcsB-dependent stress response